MIHCIYASVSARHWRDDELKALLVAARAKNRRLGVTGMLLHADGCFFQVLEGPAAGVDAVYADIEADPRHEQVTLIVRESIPHRAFDRWTMGLASASAEEIAALPGLNDFLHRPGGLAALDAGRAMKLLDAFRRGRWRLRLHEPAT
ncbi:BLUF domain-containing protein [Ideonella sp.]|uniref:BLUF domain-containing protein n=1 Tax=Ideonella sp. TaxID=1929293 RepID=UPI0035B21C00